MEVIGAVASVIAIGQAVAAVPKIVGVLRSVPNANNEAASLMNELETVRLIYAQMEDLLKRDAGCEKTWPDLKADSFPSVETGLLRRAVDELSAVVKSLEAFCADYRPESRLQTRTRAKTVFRWLWNKHRVPELYQRTQGVRINLQVAMNAMLVDMQYSQKKMLLDIRRVFHDSFHHLSDGQSQIQLLLEQGPGNPSKLEETTEMIGSKPGASTKDKTGSEREIEQSNVSRRACPTSDEQRNPLVYFEATPVKNCPPTCNCQCHRDHKSYRSPSWARAILGSFFVSYDAVPIFDKSECDQTGCQRSRSPTTLQYSFPLWFCARSLCLSASVDSLTNMGGTLHFTVGRVLANDDRIWSALGLGASNDDRLHRLLNVYAYLPADCSEDGQSILECALVWRQWSYCQALLRIWDPILRKKGCSRRTAALARRALAYRQYYLERPSQSEQTALRKLIALAPETNNRGHSIRLAVRLDDLVALQTAIHDEPDGLDLLGDTDEAAIHIATELENIAAVKILSDHGANINQADEYGTTPLMKACRSSSLAMLRFFIEAGCPLRSTDNNRDTALHIAASNPAPESAEMVELLLLCDRSLVHMTNLSGETPLFSWTGDTSSTAETEEALARKLRALRVAGCDIQAKDRQGFTVLFTAIYQNNYSAFRLLIEAGARYDQHGRFGQTIFHDLASCAYNSSLPLFSDLDLDLDTELEEDFGYTPWDFFIGLVDAEGVWTPAQPIPSDDQAENFVRCFTKFRNRNLGKDITALEAVMCSLRQRRGREATTILQEMIDRKLPSSARSSRRRSEVQTYRTVVLQVREGMWDAAEEAVQENLEILREEVKSSPWEQNSVNDGPRAKQQKEKLRRAALEGTDDGSCWNTDDSDRESDEDSSLDDD